AKEAQKKERALTRARESSNLVDAMNGELTYAVALHLGSMYEGNGMEDEALHVYRGLLEQRALLPPVAGWARLNMGNVYYRKGRYAEAIKMYRMTLDQIPSTSHKAMRLKVYRNIGYAFVR
ncbi:intraflagellar transport 88-like protein, partial [Nannochloropsis gaditana CCMP526]